MPRSNGRKIKGNKLGSSLMKSRNRRKIQKKEYIQEHKAEEIGRKEGKRALDSVLEIDTVSDFLYQAELTQKKFDAVKGERYLIQGDKDFGNNQVIIDLRTNTIVQEAKFDSTKAEADMKHMKVPRKPKWDGVRTPKEQTMVENNYFHDWRKRLAILEEKYHFSRMTPYEKNIEMWRQLWRVVEKSDILVQIVDGRDPLFFRCEDFSDYVTEVNESKMNILLINKSDLLAEEVRAKWSDYLNEKKIDHVFFSALIEQKEVDVDQKEEVVEEDVLSFKNTPRIVKRESLKSLLKKLVILYREIRKVKMNLPIQEVTELEENDGEEEKEEEIVVVQKEEEKVEEVKEKVVEEMKEGGQAPKQDQEGDEEEGEEEEVEDPAVIAKRLKEGKKLVAQLKRNKFDENPDLVTIGMVGFPNVGKSSVINVLCGKKLVGVAARPGKTRNFQTIYLEKDLLLCDCPGLVFPSVSATKAQMVCNGVYPIDNLREFMDPVKYLVSYVPRKVFEYHLKFSCSSEEERVEASRLLHCYATSRGYMVAGSGLPNYHQAARIILKKVVNGEILFCKLPPGDNKIIPSQFNEVPDEFVPRAPIMNEKDNKGKVYKSAKQQREELENGFFANEVDEEDLFDISTLTQDDIIDLVRGQKVFGVKLQKDQRRELKWAIKRDADSQTVFGMLDAYINGVKSKFIHVKRRQAEEKLKR